MIVNGPEARQISKLIQVRFVGKFLRVLNFGDYLVNQGLTAGQAHCGRTSSGAARTVGNLPENWIIQGSQIVDFDLRQTTIK